MLCTLVLVGRIRGFLFLYLDGLKKDYFWGNIRQSTQNGEIGAMK
jgi:hypothetical protein